LLIGNQLFAQVPGREKQELRPLSVNEYFATEFDAEVTFLPDIEGAIRTIMLRLAGQLIFAHKLAEAQATSEPSFVATCYESDFRVPVADIVGGGGSLEKAKLSEKRV
jgi:hypothetical protein